MNKRPLTITNVKEELRRVMKENPEMKTVRVVPLDNKTGEIIIFLEYAGNPFEERGKLCSFFSDYIKFERYSNQQFYAEPGEEDEEDHNHGEI